MTDTRMGLVAGFVARFVAMTRSVCVRSITTISAACAVMLLHVLAGVGCSSDPTRGYTIGNTRTSDVQTVAVPVFGNDTFDRELATQLTVAVVSELQTAGYRVARRDVADTTLTGTITDSRLIEAVEGRSGLGQEYLVELTISYEWTDNRSGSVLLSRRNVRVSESFTPARGVGEPIEIGQNSAVQRLARTIVHSMRSSW